MEQVTARSEKTPAKQGLLQNGHITESPERVPDRQMGRPSFVLGGQYPMTAYYVNLGLTFQIDCHIWRILPRWG